MTVIRELIQSIKLYLHRGEKFYGLSIAEWGFVPRNRGLYRLALLHRSASMRTRGGGLLNYERLEFLGDAVLGAIVADVVYRFFPNKDEGFMTQLRSKIVSRESLNGIAIQMGLDKEVIAHADISRNKHIYGDVFEAFTGAIYLDQGYERTKAFVENYVFPNYVDIEQLVHEDRNYKSQLVEWAQRERVEFRVQTVPANARQTKFISTIAIGSRVMGQGVGSSKKEAEQKSAAVVMRKVQEGEFVKGEMKGETKGEIKREVKGKRGC